MDFNDRLLAALSGDRARPLMEYYGRSYTRGDIMDLGAVRRLFVEMESAA